LEVRKVEAIFVANPLEKRPVRSQGLRLEDNIKTNLRKIFRESGRWLELRIMFFERRLRCSHCWAFWVPDCSVKCALHLKLSCQWKPGSETPYRMDLGTR